MTMPATAIELQKLLKERNLYPWHAAADGTDPYDGYGLKREGDKWVVYLHAPMTAPDERYFANEEEAIVHLVERLRHDGFADYLKDL